MKVQFLLSFVTFVTSLGLGDALKCYVCAGSNLSDCAKGSLSSMSVQECPGSQETTLSAPISIPQAGKTKTLCLEAIGTDYKPAMAIRGCGVFPSNVDPCTFINKYVPVKKCQTCSSDLCDKNPLNDDENDVSSSSEESEHPPEV